jgi:ketosteroid isomerase-like protein
MTHPNEDRLRKGYAAFAAGDLDTVRTLFADDIVWHVPGKSQLAGDYKGIDETFGFFGKLMELSSGTFKIEVHDCLANDTHGVALEHATADRSGKHMDANSTGVFHVNDEGKVTEYWGIPVDAYQEDEFWG